MDDKSLLLQVKNLKTYFFLEEGTVQAVDGVEFEVPRGETLGVVGESGCGKSVTAQSVLRIVPHPGRIVGGEVIYYHQRLNNDFSDVTEAIKLTELNPRGRRMRDIRGSEISMVFQEPMTSLTPVYTIGTQIVEAITLHQDVTQSEARERAVEALRRVEMPKPSQTVDSYPHQLSGGMRQRAMITIALSCHPSLLIADEPTTALDVTTEAQILDLMRGLQEEIGMSIMYITHDLGVIAEMSDDVIVMYLGKVAERADVDSIFYKPRHPYTRALLKSIPQLTREKQQLEPIKGIVPDPYSIPRGCPFWPRCPEFISGVCDEEEPEYVSVEPDHDVRCHLYS